MTPTGSFKQHPELAKLNIFVFYSVITLSIEIFDQFIP